MNAIVSPEAEVDLDVLGDRIARTSASVDAATHTLLSDVREFDRREGWARQGLSSCAEWLSWKCGIELGAAREKVRVARALAALPRIDAELRQGQLSFSKVRALTRVATPETEARFVELARASTAAQLEKTCRLIGQLRPRDFATDEERRWLRARDLPNGMVRLEAQLRPDEAARVMAAIDVFASKAAERADALLTMAEATLRGEKPDRPPVEIVLHVDAASLTGTHGDTGVPAETCRRLLCDAGITIAFDDEQGSTIDLGRKHRVFCGAIRKALLARAEGKCQYPGCTHRRFLEAHHVVPWVEGGETTVSNGLMACSFHHRLLHEGGFRVEATDGGFIFFRPDGREVWATEPPPCPGPLADVSGLPPTWDGDRVDYGAAVAYAVEGRW